MSYSSLLPVVSITALTVLETAVGVPVLPDIMDMSKRYAATVGTSLETTFERPGRESRIVGQSQSGSFSDMLADELGTLRGSSASASAPTVNADAQAVQAEATAEGFDAAQSSSDPASEPAPRTAAEPSPVGTENAASLFESASRGRGLSSGPAGSVALPQTEFASLSPETLRVGDPLFEPGNPGAQPLISRENPARPVTPGSTTDVPAVSLPIPLFLMLGAIACLGAVRLRRLLVRHPNQAAGLAS